MNEVLDLAAERHARASTQAGRGTSDGHGVSAGHCSENQTITSSYFRAVKVRESSLLKKRQSPAAKRPIVARLTDRAAAYAEAQDKRLDRSSDSMRSENSRNFPTDQDRFAGNFRLAGDPAKSDKSAMPTVNQVRTKIQEVLDEAQKGPVTVARELGFPRDYLRDFLEGKKRSLKIEFMTSFSEQYGVPLRDLTPARAQADEPPRLYISEHMKARGWDDAALARRIEGIAASAVAKWRADPSRLQDWQVSALLHAFDMTNRSDLARLPHPAKKRANS